MLQILANYNYKDADPLSSMVDVKDKDGYTVLHAAVKTAWVAGVCIALEAGADVTITVSVYNIIILDDNIHLKSQRLN